MNYSLNSSRLSTLDGGVGLLSSRVVYNTAYAGDACRLFFWGGGELPLQGGGKFVLGRKSTNHSGTNRQGIPIGFLRLGLQLFEHWCGRGLSYRDGGMTAIMLCCTDEEVFFMKKSPSYDPIRYQLVILTFVVRSAIIIYRQRYINEIVIQVFPMKCHCVKTNHAELQGSHIDRCQLNRR